MQDSLGFSEFSGGTFYTKTKLISNSILIQSISTLILRRGSLMNFYENHYLGKL